MTIAQVSQKFGLSIDTLRYYERVGLIPSVNRNQSGIRDYTEMDLNWVEFVKCMRSAGIPIEALIEYMALVHQGEETAELRKALLVRERDQLAERMAQMQKTLDRLNMKIEHYDQTIGSKEAILMQTEESPLAEAAV